LIVLFDLDGTLVDSAPDLHDALSALCAESARPPPSPAATRRVVSLGSRALLASALGPLPDDPEAYEALRRRFLTLYAATAYGRTSWMEGVPELLSALGMLGHRWGIVTNKPAALTKAVLARLDVGRFPPPAAVVAGDTLSQRKPDPAPLLYALRTAGADPREGLYVGDAAADIEAARRAGLPSFVALWGYLGENPAPETWGADGLLEHPGELLDAPPFHGAGGRR
jgi:2-phosphoglycolate phosphatase